MGKQSQIKRERRARRSRGESTEKPERWRAANEAARPHRARKSKALRPKPAPATDVPSEDDHGAPAAAAEQA